MVVQHNISAMNANRMYGITEGVLKKSTEKLSSGYKINRAADDAAGLAISEKMRRQIRGLTQASANAEDGISVVQTAEGALEEVHSMLQRINELTVKAANDTLTSEDRNYIQQEVSALVSEIDRTSSTTEFNNQYLLDGTFSGKYLQVGSENDGNDRIGISISAMTAKGIGILGLKVSGTAGADNAMGAITTVKSAITSVSKMRSDLGAIQNRLEHTIKNLDNIVENTTAAESEIRDTDMATEMVRYSSANILAQAGQSMLAQANQSQQGVTQLLQ
ncbi:flagellin [Lachnospiraceae bacterium KH1T2]|nr:flagellin [Lachnospiraceae bacterium KH1T2]